MFYFVRLFKWVLGLELRPMLKWQAFYQLTHLPSSQQLSFFIGIFVMLEVTKRTQSFWWQREEYFRMQLVEATGKERADDANVLNKERVVSSEGTL